MLHLKTLVALAASIPSLGEAAVIHEQSGAVAASSNFSYFKPPTLRPFFHINLLLDRPVSTTTTEGVSIRVPNRGGKITGNLTGDIVPVGAAIELFSTAAKGTTSFYTNAWVVNTTQGTILNMNGQITVHYGNNNALHGFGPITFSTGEAQYLNLNYNSYYAELDGSVTMGVVNVDVFQLVSNGRVDGTMSPALLSPN